MRYTLTLCFTPSTLLVEHFMLKLMSEQKMGKKQENTRNENYNDYRFKAYRNIFSCGNRSFTFIIFGLLRYLKFW